tara:strand:+ start:93 stop:569 length:477 start_codon:yes stop_codon:yes gene_type:complete
MIIECHNCNKKFDIDTALIPSEGRLLQCNNCDHKWFFKKKTTLELIEPIKDKKLNIFESSNIDQNKLSNPDISIKTHNKIRVPKEENTKKVNVNEIKKPKKYRILNLIIIFLISFVAIIILVDTFKTPISIVFPNIEFLLYNLYESIIDIILFINDLI